MMKGNKALASMASVAMSLSMMATMAAVPTVAMASEDYTYTVRVFSGNKGDVDGQEMVSLEYHKGDAIDLTTDIGIDVTDPAYYHKGFREAGRDDEFEYRSFDVNRDLDLVVSYGMRTQMARLTVHFQEYQTGKPLATEDGSTEATYEFKIGDKPVVPFKYVEGYRPLYRNLTGTITEDTDWYLDYVPLQAGEEPVTQTDEGTAQQQTGSQGTGTTTGNQTTGGADGEAASNAQPGGADDTTGGNADGNAGQQVSTDEDGTASGDIYPPTQDIGDNDVPLYDALDSKKKPESATQDEPESGIIGWIRNHTVAVSVMSAIVLGLAMVLIVLIVSKGRRKDNQQ